MAKRDFDVVVLGATGFTGQRVAAYLAERAAETDLRWAPAARDADKLQRVLADHGVQAPELLHVDIDEPATLRDLCARATVVLNMVGPYAKFGPPVIEAAIAEGAHYVDLTGEMPFVRDMIDAHHDAAHAAQVKLVQVCGFESLPPDLAVGLVARAAREELGEELAEVTIRVTSELPPGLPRPSDLISGGTFQSLRLAVASDDAGAIADPAILVQDPARAKRVREDSPVSVRPRRGTGTEALAPMVPSPFLNPAVIHRSNELLASEGAELGSSLTYREHMALPGGTPTLGPRLAAAAVVSATAAGTRALASAPGPVRRAAASGLKAIGPGSGDGPAPDRLEGWSWTVQCDARTTGGAGVHLLIEADGHPGYLTTARMMGEAGMLLAETEATPDRYGCVTPSLALGLDEVDRFARAGLRFSAVCVDA
ncbi:MAG: saccharopine dehydrogenase family protein [Solirubrobacterales bacterium]